MKQRLVEIYENMRRYNPGSFCRELYGLDPEILYDALVVAPGWKPTKIIRDDSFKVTVLEEHTTLSGYLVEKDGLRIAWIHSGTGACNLLDQLSVCVELRFKRLIFVGAVGSLTKSFSVGDFCTPTECIEGVMAGAYLAETLEAPFLYQKVCPDLTYVEKIQNLAAASGHPLHSGKVFCTDSISLEYSHLEEIRATGAELIEMETSTFYRLAELFEIPAIALLIVSDNSATGDPLLGRDNAASGYHEARCTIIPEMIVQIAKM